MVIALAGGVLGLRSIRDNLLIVHIVSRMHLRFCRNFIFYGRQATVICILEVKNDQSFGKRVSSWAD